MGWRRACWCQESIDVDLIEPACHTLRDVNQNNLYRLALAGIGLSTGAVLLGTASILQHVVLLNWEMTTSETISNLVAAVALVFSVIALLRQELRNREADVSLWFGKTVEGAGASDRLVIVNHGPAIAHTISAEFYNENGDTWELRTQTGEPFPISILSPGDEVHIPMMVIMGTAHYVRARLTWKDRRIGQQVRETTQSLTGIPIGVPKR